MFLDLVQVLQGKLISAVLITLVNMSLTLSCKLVEVYWQFLHLFVLFYYKSMPKILF